MRRVFLAAVVLAIGLTPDRTLAATIDFEDAFLSPGGATTEFSFVSGGFLFGTTDHLHRFYQFPGQTDSGSTSLQVHNVLGDNLVSMASSGGGTFGLTSAWFGESYLPQPFQPANATQVVVTGNLFGGGTITKTITLDGIFDGIGGVPDFQTELFDASWVNLTSVVFNGTGGFDEGWGLDNVVVDLTPAVSPDPVPEPGTLLLIGSAAAGAIARRRRTSR